MAKGTPASQKSLKAVKTASKAQSQMMIQVSLPCGWRNFGHTAIQFDTGITGCRATSVATCRNHLMNSIHYIISNQTISIVNRATLSQHRVLAGLCNALDRQRGRPVLLPLVQLVLQNIKHVLQHLDTAGKLSRPQTLHNIVGCVSCLVFELPF